MSRSEYKFFIGSTEWRRTAQSMTGNFSIIAFTERASIHQNGFVVLEALTIVVARNCMKQTIIV